MIYKDGVYTEVVAIVDGKETRVKQSPEIRAAQLAANALHKEMTGQEMVITAILDGSHMSGSKHYEGDAFDLRRWYIGGKVKEFIAALKTSLGPDYDVVNEPTHIHVEYDPKK
jgi:hypothetical protein